MEIHQRRRSPQGTKRPLDLTKLTSAIAEILVILLPQKYLLKNIYERKGMKRPCSVILVNGLPVQAMQDIKYQDSHCCHQVICHQQKKYSIDD